MFNFDLISSYQVIKWLHILNFNIFETKINFSAHFLFIFPAQASSRRRLGSGHPLKKPLKTQNDQFQFNIQLLGDKMDSYFEFQNISSKNKLLGAILVHFSSPSVVANPLKKHLRKQNAHFRFNTQLVGAEMASHFEFQNFSSKNKLLRAIFVHFSSPSVVATTLGPGHPLEKPLRKQNDHFRFNIQLVVDKMASHFEFQHF